MAGSASVETTDVDRGVVAKVNSDMDYVTCLDLWEPINEVLGGSAAFVVLDLSAVPFCDSAGLNLLLMASRQAASHEVELALACVPASLMRLLKVTGIDQILKAFDTVFEAERALSRGCGGLNHR
ncbi:STAS domain-containing protein [Streptomyces sp. NPDC056337]|uniref:STAS domain-containing protein n=1 Tax=Streptomyces sp. NPDC056337 TaxID=3345787 RepID=UPI0035DED2A2